MAMDFDTFVDDCAAEIDSEAGPQPQMMPGPQGAAMSPGSLFSQIMREVRNRAGSIPFGKLLMVAAVVYQGIQAGKGWQEILQDALAVLTS